MLNSVEMTARSHVHLGVLSQRTARQLLVCLLQCPCIDGNGLRKGDDDGGAKTESLLGCDSDNSRKG